MPHFRHERLGTGLSPMDFFYFAIRRRNRGVDLYYEVFKEAPTPQQACDGKAARETGHGLEEISEDEYPHFVKIHRHPRAADHSAEFIANPILQPTDP